MSVRKCALMVALALLGLVASPLQQPSMAQTEPAQAEAGPPPIDLSLTDAIQMGLKNNLDIKVAQLNPNQREQDIAFQEAVFDPNIGVSAQKQDNHPPGSFRTDTGIVNGEVVSTDSIVYQYSAGFSDRLHIGGSYSARLDMSKQITNSKNSTFPTSFPTAVVLAYNQSFLRNLGRKANEAQIVVAQTNQKISQSQFRDQVLTVLNSTEDAYWELVFARQDLGVKNESLRLANELLKLNKIKVQVGTLPPIEITTAEAEVANREQGVIVADNAVKDAEDNLRRVLNMPKQDQAWDRSIAPTDQPTFVERPVDLPQEIDKAMSHRPDMEQARLAINNTDSLLSYQRNQLKWDLTGRATYSRQGLSGDFSRRPAILDPNGVILSPSISPFNESFNTSLDRMGDRDFESWSIGAFLNIPVGNNAAQATYVQRRLDKEQATIGMQNTQLKAEVAVRTAARAIVTGKKRIEAADKNVELQKKKVEAEQKKFENGMSTSFQVLTFQQDLADALGAQNRAMVDYRKSLAALELATGTLDDYLKVQIQ